MNAEDIRKFCLAKPGVTECYPFDEVTMVMKIMSKMFILVSLDNIPVSMSLKFDPEDAMEARERYSSVTPGFHLNKKYWNTIVLDNSVGESVLREWITDSYELVKKGLKKSELQELENMNAV